MTANTRFRALALLLLIVAGCAALEPQINTCPICLHSGRFLPAGEPSRAFATCPSCGSLERHRMLYLYLRQKTNLFRAEVSVLHFSPEAGLGGALAAQKNLKYATSWYGHDRALRAPAQ